ncbi:MAG: YdcF family protein [Candidatus Sericytochromatia bacterium]
MKLKFKKFFKIIIIINLVFNYACFYNKNNQKKELKHYDVIVVLGCPATSNCEVSSLMKERVDKGLELLKQKLSSKIMFTGNAVANNCIEAEVMAKYANSKGISFKNIIIENKAKNTYQNAYFSIKKIKELKFKNLGIVTSDFHKERADYIFSKYNITYFMYSAKIPKEFSNFDILKLKIREKLAWVYLFIFGYKNNYD